MPASRRPGYHPTKQPLLTMPVDPQLRALDIEIPTQPEVLVKLSLLMADEDIDLQAVSSLVETDMALAAAVLKAVNSSLYGLRGRVQTVHQALTYLGMREVAAITFEMGLRAAFPPAVELEPVWSRAAKRGLLMGRAAVSLNLHAWRAQSAGLFAQSGQAVLCLHAPTEYPAMLARHPGLDLAGLLDEETASFGLSHEVLGSSLCRAWGLAGDVADYVRERPHPHDVWAQRSQAVRALLALGAVADAAIAGVELQPIAEEVSEVGGVDASALAKAVAQHWQRINDASAED